MNNFRILIISGISVLILLILTDLVLSTVNKKQSAVITTLQTLTNTITTNNQDPTSTPKPEPTTDPLAGLPKLYKDIPIPQELYTQGFQRYQDVKAAETRRYILNRVQRYYIFRDYIQGHNLSFQFIFPLTFVALEKEVPRMEKLLEEQAVTNIDFAYIKARFRYSPAEESAKAKFGDLDTKARQMIEAYRQKFLAANPDVQQIVNDSNQDADLMLLNNDEPNEYKTGFKPNDRIFFTDRHIKPFLFAQTAGKVSEVYTLHSVDDSEYAYLIIYIVNGQKRDYSSLDEIVRQNVGFFKI